jgi:hypothetical protein
MADQWQDLEQFASQPGYVRVVGPLWTGPRITIVHFADPASWPRWIQDDGDGQPVDDGSMAGGTWSGGVQSLPELSTTVERFVSGGLARWWPLALLVGVLIVSSRRKR